MYTHLTSPTHYGHFRQLVTWFLKHRSHLTMHRTIGLSDYFGWTNGLSD